MIIIGAGAAGLMAAMTAGQRGRRVLVLDHANKAGKKILMSGGGRCNFTNLTVKPEHFISQNPQFCRSALSRYTPDDFIALVEKHQIPYHEKTRGQLFCDEKSKAILNLLLAECSAANVTIQLNTKIENITQCNESRFLIKALESNFYSDSLIIATGGLSIPTLGATGFGYQVAAQFAIPVHKTRPALVPLTLHNHDKERFSLLSGVSVDCKIRCGKHTFHESMLFTHRGLSGPAILQISSYWQPGEPLEIQLCPDINWVETLNSAKDNHSKTSLNSILSQYLPKRFVSAWVETPSLPLQAYSNKVLHKIADHLESWPIKPNGTEGYRTAEVTLGGVDCNAISSKTFEAKKVPGLYFIGEVLDVTGWLGGYNFQWAWSSGYVAGQYC